MEIVCVPLEKLDLDAMTATTKTPTTLPEGGYNEDAPKVKASARSMTSYCIKRMLEEPPAVVAEVLRELLDDRPPPGSDYHYDDPHQRDLTTQLLRIRAHLVEESDRFQKLIGKLRRTRELCESVERSTETRRKACDGLVRETKLIRDEERAAKDDARAARLAATAASKGTTDQIHAIECALAKEHERMKRLRSKLAADGARADELEAQSDALRRRVEAAERDSAAMLAREAAAAATLRALSVADRDRVDLERRRRDAELDLGRSRERCEDAEVLLEVARVKELDARSKLDEVQLRGEGLRYRLVDAMRDVACMKERVFHAESMCCTGF
jgi:chromosome segregation ATPase